MSGVPSQRVADAYEFCRRVTADQARSFYLGLRLAPEPERSALYALYAWNRLGDDIADETARAVPERRAALDRFEEATAAACRGEPEADTPVWLALSDVVERFAIDTSCFDAMITGLRRDLDPRQPETRDDLFRYCDEVAGSVGRCCVAVWGVRDGVSESQAGELASRLGRAFQLTNVLRDVGEDARLDPPRLYLPRDLLAAHGVTTDTLLSWLDPDACRAAVHDLAAEARGSFRVGSELLDLIRPRFRPTLWAMMRVYERTLQLIEQDPRRSVRGTHIRPSRAAALSIAFRAFAMSAMTSGRV